MWKCIQSDSWKIKSNHGYDGLFFLDINLMNEHHPLIFTDVISVG